MLRASLRCENKRAGDKKNKSKGYYATDLRLIYTRAILLAILTHQQHPFTFFQQSHSRTHTHTKMNIISEPRIRVYIGHIENAAHLIISHHYYYICVKLDRMRERERKRNSKMQHCPCVSEIVYNDCSVTRCYIMREE